MLQLMLKENAALQREYCIHSSEWEEKASYQKINTPGTEHLDRGIVKAQEREHKGFDWFWRIYEHVT